MLVSLLVFDLILFRPMLADTSGCGIGEYAATSTGRLTRTHLPELICKLWLNVCVKDIIAFDLTSVCAQTTSLAVPNGGTDRRCLWVHSPGYGQKVWQSGVACDSQYEMLCKESAARHQRALEINENAGHRRERWTLINQPFFFGRSPAFAMPRSADGRSKRCLNPAQVGEVPVAHQRSCKQ